MATVALNTADNIQFVNFVAGVKADNPTLIVQSGDWQVENAVEAGIIFDVTGDQPPILNPNDARKLAKWLTRAADDLDGKKKHDKKSKPRHYYEEDEEDAFDRY